ncbi:MAG: Rhodanese domain protein [Candidatus Levybacteria bacterium GW2011_GWA2_40_8]|nr:MAG: Rhodanese domain protein [Candidatus Levybacteria bacterium GW2011_GWA2_40_8]
MNKKLTPLAFLSFILILASVNFLSNEIPAPQEQTRVLKTGYKNITSTQLKEMFEDKNFFLVNVHIPYEGEIEKTDVFIPYDEIEKNLDKLPKNKNAKIVLYCQTGRMSAIAAQRLTKLGYTDVYNHLFGMHDWQSKGYPLLEKGE